MCLSQHSDVLIKQNINSDLYTSDKKGEPLNGENINICPWDKNHITAQSVKPYFIVFLWKLYLETDDNKLITKY